MEKKSINLFVKTFCINSLTIRILIKQNVYLETKQFLFTRRLTTNDLEILDRTEG